MRKRPIHDQTTIVLVGRFNPAIFHPMWFALNNLIGKKDAENAEVIVTHPEFSQFRIDDLEISVGTERFSMTNLTLYGGLIKDLLIGVFGNHLRHTPIAAMGINRSIHFDCGNFEIRDCVGSSLAPKEPWGEWGPLISGAPGNAPEHGGLVLLVMQQKKRLDQFRGYIQAKVGLSPLKRESGVLVEVNDHYQLVDTGEEIVGCTMMQEVLERNFEKSLDFSAFISDQIMALAEKCSKE